MDYKRHVRDLYALTCKTGDGQWTPVHTATLNNIAEKICNHMKSELVDL